MSTKFLGVRYAKALDTATAKVNAAGLTFIAAAIIDFQAEPSRTKAFLKGYVDACHNGLQHLERDTLERYVRWAHLGAEDNSGLILSGAQPEAKVKALATQLERKYGSLRKYGDDVTGATLRREQREAAAKAMAEAQERAKATAENVAAMPDPDVPGVATPQGDGVLPVLNDTVHTADQNAAVREAREMALATLAQRVVAEAAAFTPEQRDAMMAALMAASRAEAEVVAAA